MARALRPGGQLALLVPAHPRLYGNLDRAYGHYRRYTRSRVEQLVAGAQLELVDLYSFNLLGIRLVGEPLSTLTGDQRRVAAGLRRGAAPRVAADRGAAPAAVGTERDRARAQAARMKFRGA